MYLKDGHTVRSLKARNKDLAPWLPERNSGAYQAIIDYTKFLLGISAPGAPFPPNPSPTEIAQLAQILPEAILSDMAFTCIIPSEPTTESTKLLPRQTDYWLRSKALFLSDLARYQIPRATVATKPETMSTAWNPVMLAVLLKHWRWAKEHGAFSRYSVNPKFFSEAVARAVMERWIRGRETAASRSNVLKMNNQRRNHVSTSQKTSDDFIV